MFGGVFVYQHFVKSQFSIIKSQINSNVQNSNTETARWKTYANLQTGLQFRYPQGWGNPQLNLLSTRIKISFSENGNISLDNGLYYNQNLSRNMTFDEIRNSFEDVFPAGNLINTKNIVIDKKECVEFSYSDSNDSGILYISIFIPRDDNGTISSIDFSYKPNDGTITNFNNFISTIKFTK